MKMNLGDRGYYFMAFEPVSIIEPGASLNGKNIPAAPHASVVGIMLIPAVIASNTEAILVFTRIVEEGLVWSVIYDSTRVQPTIRCTVFIPCHLAGKDNEYNISLRDQAKVTR